MRNLLLFCLILFAGQSQAETLRISAEALKDQLQQKHLSLVDVRKVEDFEMGHITGAINFPIDLTYDKKSESGRVVPPNLMQQLMRERGLDQNSNIVVYDDGAIVDAARLLWVLEVYGVKQVKILSSGFNDWTGKKYPVDDRLPDITPSNYVATIDNKRLASKFATQVAMADSNQVIVDARFPDGYQGKTSTAKRFGHIPTAVNIPISHNIQKDNGVAKLRSLEELTATYSSLPKDKKVLTYCEIGRASSVTYLVLREMGYNVANYDGSWREWGNDINLPIEK